MAFGRAVWASISTQLETMSDSSTLTSYLNLQAGVFVFVVAYYFLHKWFWSQLLWLSFGALRFVPSLTHWSQPR